MADLLLDSEAPLLRVGSSGGQGVACRLLGADDTVVTPVDGASKRVLLMVMLFT
jgi:hypothetical protein